MKRISLGRRAIYMACHWRSLYLAKSRHFWASLRLYPGCVVINFVGFEVAVVPHHRSAGE